MGIVNWMKKSILVGLGVVGMGKKKAGVVVEKVSKQAAVAEKEGKIVARELVKETRKQGKKVQDVMNEGMDKVLETKRKR